MPGRRQLKEVQSSMSPDPIWAHLQTTIFGLTAVYNAILTYEAYEDRKSIWRIVGSGATTVFLAVITYLRLLDL